MAHVPPPLPETAIARFEEMVSVCADPGELPTVDRGAWTVASSALLEACSADAASAVLDAVGSVEAELTAQVAHGAAQLQIARGQLAAIRALVDGVESAITALAVAGDCPACRSGEIRAALARVRALADLP